MDRLTSLNVFKHVVECEGFAAAARRLNMSAAMASKHVAGLEKRLGIRLINRTTRKIGLTDAGKQYYDRTRQILSDLDDADQLVESFHSSIRGSLKVFTSVSLVRFLSPIIDLYLSRNSEISVDLMAGEQMPDLLELGYDLAIMANPPASSTVIIRRLTPWRHTLCCSPEYLRRRGSIDNPSQLSKHNCLRYTYYPFGNDWRFQGPDGITVSVTVGGNAASNSGELLRSLALAGQGIFLAPSFVIAEDIRKSRLIELMPEFRPLEFSINAMFPHRAFLPSKVREFIDLVAERFLEHKRWMTSESLLTNSGHHGADGY